MDALSELENAISADLLRADLLGAPRPGLAGRYLLRRFLGRGASGLVVEATDTRLGRTVALKLGDVRATTSMVTEARALAALDHPNVVRVHDVDEVDATFDGKPFELWFVSMQRVSGSSLRTWLLEAPRTRDAIVRVFLDAGRGLYAAHAAKILHRDFKPDNVIVRDDGVAQVLDFGFATPAVSMFSELLGEQSEVVGTDPYLAPEARLARASRRSDQYSFAVSLVEALTGQPQPARGEPPAGVPAALWSALERATNDELEPRFPNLGELLAAIELAMRPPAAAHATRTRVLGLVAIALVGLAAYVAIVRPEPARRVARRARTALRSLATTHAGDAGAPPMPVDAGAARPTPGDASSARAADAGAAAILPAVCPPIAGRYALTTRDETPGRTDAPLVGEYLLELADAAGSVRVLGFRKTASGREGQLAPRVQELDAPTLVRAPDCGATLRATLPGARGYEFVLRFEADGVAGSFSTQPIRAESPFRGSVVGRLVRAR